MANPITLERRAQAWTTQQGPNLRTRMRRGFWGYLFVSPWILVYAAFGLYPLLLSFYLTFFTYSFVRPEDYVFVGIGNWIQGLLDPLFWKSIVNIFYNQVIFIALTNIIGLVTALLLYKVVKGGRIFRTIYFMPVITSVVVLMAIGGYLASPEGPVQANLVQHRAVKKPGLLEVRPVFADAHHRGNQFLEVVWHQHGDLSGRVVRHRLRSITKPPLSMGPAAGSSSGRSPSRPCARKFSS